MTSTTIFSALELATKVCYDSTIIIQEGPREGAITLGKCFRLAPKCSEINEGNSSCEVQVSSYIRSLRNKRNLRVTSRLAIKMAQKQLPSNMKVVEKDDLDDELTKAGSKPVVVDFTASW